MLYSVVFISATQQEKSVLYFLNNKCSHKDIFGCQLQKLTQEKRGYFNEIVENLVEPNCGNSSMAHSLKISAQKFYFLFQTSFLLFIRADHQFFITDSSYSKVKVLVLQFTWLTVPGRHDFSSNKQEISASLVAQAVKNLPAMQET